MNAIEFKEQLKVSSYRRSKEIGIDYEVDINNETYYIVRHASSAWSALSIDNSEEYAHSTTRKDVLAAIKSGLFSIHQINNQL